MAELDVFERRVADALRSYATEMPAFVDAAAVADRVAGERTHREWRSAGRLAAVPAVAWVLVGVLLAASGLLLAGGLHLPWVTPPAPTSVPSAAPVPSAPPSAVALERHPRALVPTDIVSAPSLADWATVLADREGNVWVLGSGMLLRLDPADGTSRTWTARDDAAFQALQVPSVAAVAAGGGIWLATDDQLMWFDGTGFRDVIDGPPGMETGVGVAEAPDGTLWAVTGRGVVHWDGVTWAPAAAGRPSTADGPIAVDRTGRVWVGEFHYSGPVGDGVSVYDGTAWRTYTAADGAPNLAHAIVAAPDGSVWVATESRLARFDGTSWRAFDYPLSGFAPPSLAIAPDGTAWVTRSECDGRPVRVARFDGQAWNVFEPRDGLPDADTRCRRASVVATDEHVLVVADDVAYRLAGARWERVWSAPESIRGPASSALFVAVSRDELWATDGGLWHWRDGDWFSEPDYAVLPGVPSSSATLALGPDGRAWLASALGVAVREGGHWTLVDDRPAKTVAPAADGTAWVGGETADSDVRTLGFDGSAWRSEAAPDTPFGSVASMAIDREGTVWATSMDFWPMDPAGCLARLVGDRWEIVEPFGPGLECYAEVKVSPDGDVWISGEAHPHGYAGGWGSDGVAARFDGRTWTVYDEADGLRPVIGCFVYGFSACQTLAFTPDGAAWVATKEGIARFDGTRWTMVVDDGRGYGPIAAAPDGSVWAAGPAGLELVAETGAAP